MRNPALKTLDSCIDEILLPVFLSHGFNRKSLRRFERQGLTPKTLDVIEVQLGKNLVSGCFAINARIVEVGKEDVPWKVVCRLGSFPFSFLRLPQILFFTPLMSFVIPALWVCLFTDCWWRYSRFSSYTHLAVLDARWLFVRQAIPKFESIHRKSNH
jgi:hypothetical protein